MARKKLSPYQKYTNAQHRIAALIAKHGSREHLLEGRLNFIQSKDPQFKVFENDYRTLCRNEDICRTWNEDSSCDQNTSTAPLSHSRRPAAQDPPLAQDSIPSSHCSLQDNGDPNDCNCCVVTNNLSFVTTFHGDIDASLFNNECNPSINCNRNSLSERDDDDHTNG